MAKGLWRTQLRRNSKNVVKRFNLDSNTVDETLMAKGLDRRVWLCAAVEQPKDRTALITSSLILDISIGCISIGCTSSSSTSNIIWTVLGLPTITPRDFSMQVIL